MDKIRIRLALVLWMALLFTPITLHPQSPPACLSYEPSLVQLRGTIVRKTFPGRPNYESTKQGDEAETYWLLVLSKPICTAEDKSSPDLNPAQQDIQQIQLVFPDANAYKTYRELVGKKISASGTLFGAHTAHHHTPVLLTVQTLSKTP